MEQHFLPRHVQMRRQYDANRYARHLSKAELDRRIRDILLNLLTVTLEAKVGLLPLDKSGINWLEKWTHVLEEMQLRHGPYPAGFTREILHSEPFPNLVSELAQKAADHFKRMHLSPNTVFIKYGKREFMESLLMEGRLRIQPASCFRRKDFNGAVRDDEQRLPLSFALSAQELKKIVTNPQDVTDNIPDQRVDVLLQSPADYWMYCVTESVEPRLFVDFEADSCVIIRDRNRFSELLRKASFEMLERARHISQAVKYVDPLLPDTAQIFLPFAKHFGFSYQFEHRFCWFPQIPVMQLAHVDIAIGSMKEFAELITI